MNEIRSTSEKETWTGLSGGHLRTILPTHIFNQPPRPAGPDIIPGRKNRDPSK